MFSFPDSSVGKESICNAADPGLIPGPGRFTEEGIGYPLQYSWVSLVAQMVKNPPAMWETWVQSLGWEDSLEVGMATHSNILAWRISMDKRILAGYSPWRCKESDTTERLRTEHPSLFFAELFKRVYISCYFTATHFGTFFLSKYGHFFHNYNVIITPNKINNYSLI